MILTAIWIQTSEAWGNNSMICCNICGRKATVGMGIYRLSKRCATVRAYVDQLFSGASGLGDVAFRRHIC